MIVLLLATLGGTIASGFFAAGRQAAGPLAGLMPVPLAGLLGDLHALISNLLVALIIVHIVGVAAEWLLTGDNLVKAMFTGRKRLPSEAAVRERPLAPAWRALLASLLSLALVAGLAFSTRLHADLRYAAAGERPAERHCPTALMLRRGSAIGAAADLAMPTRCAAR